MDYPQAKCLMFSFLCVFNAASVNGEIVLRIDPLALLSATLRTYQKAACDSDQVVIACPRGTSISIEFAQYNKFVAKDGYSIEQLCPIGGGKTGQEIRGKAKHLLRGSIFGSPTQKVPANRYVNAGYGYAVGVGGSAAPMALDTAGSTNLDATPTTMEAQTTDGAADTTHENCMWPNALQYSLLQTVVEACQKKKHCKFHGSPQFYGLGASGVGDTSGSSSYYSSTASSNAISNDPCPKRRKIVEVAYKCRPYEFRSKVACHNDVAQLECNPYSRIAIYSAAFGRTEYESIQCPQPQGVREETCLASYATETVMQICHGRRRCNLAADANTYGTPCQPKSRMYLKVVYTCVPKQVLQDRNDYELEPDEAEDLEGDINDLYDDELIYKESEAIPKLYSNTTQTGQRNSSSRATISNATLAGNQSLTNSSSPDGDATGVNPVMTHSADLSLEHDQQRLFVYLLITGSLGVLFFILILAMRLVLRKRRRSTSDTHSNSSTKGCGTSDDLGDATTIPCGFNDTISEIDVDIDLTTPIPVSSVSKNENYVTYAPASSLMLVGARQSPDVIGISSSSFVATSTAPGVSQPAVAGILAPAIVIGANAPSSNAISTMVPLTSLAQYTTAPTSLALGSPAHPPSLLSQSSMAMAPLNHGSLQATPTLRFSKPGQAAMLQPQLSYDGTAPRTLSTGVPINSQFYYG